MLAIALAACTTGARVGESGGARLADREAIEATLERYTRGLDRLDAELYTSSFAPDGVLMIYETRHEGRNALREIIAEEARLRQSQRDSGQPPRTLFHLETNSTIEFSSAIHAQHRAYWLTASRAGDKPEGLTLLGVGSSSDELQKIDGQWLITRREIRAPP
ncbi:MAG: nuclear transport factor 2 family protein [Steroidobacteraceae bacterium]